MDSTAPSPAPIETGSERLVSLLDRYKHGSMTITEAMEFVTEADHEPNLSNLPTDLADQIRLARVEIGDTSVEFAS